MTERRYALPPREETPSRPHSSRRPAADPWQTALRSCNSREGGLTRGGPQEFTVSPYRFRISCSNLLHRS